MLILALQGRSNTGKSTTLRKLGDRLELKYEVEPIEESSTEIKKIYTVFYKGKEYKVGIWSIGDTKKELKDGLKLLEDNKCHIAIVACRTRGETVKLIEGSKDFFSLVGKSKVNVQDEKTLDMINNLDAEKLEDLLFLVLQDYDKLAKTDLK